MFIFILHSGSDKNMLFKLTFEDLSAGKKILKIHIMLSNTWIGRTELSDFSMYSSCIWYTWGKKNKRRLLYQQNERWKEVFSHSHSHLFCFNFSISVLLNLKGEKISYIVFFISIYSGGASYCVFEPWSP
jgi:hypothetical protein